MHRKIHRNLEQFLEQRKKNRKNERAIFQNFQKQKKSKIFFSINISKQQKIGPPLKAQSRLYSKAF